MDFVRILLMNRENKEIFVATGAWTRASWVKAEYPYHYTTLTFLLSSWFFILYIHTTKQWIFNSNHFNAIFFWKLLMIFFLMMLLILLMIYTIYILQWNFFFLQYGFRLLMILMNFLLYGFFFVRIILYIHIHIL